MTAVLGSLAFFASGFAALVYQIVWQRLLVLPVGADVYSTTIIVAAFMAGLGCGGLAGGQLADRLSRRQCLNMFVAAELAVAVFGFVSRLVFYDGLYLALGPHEMGAFATAAVVFLGLLWPTFWMGMSLPLLSRAVTLDLSGAAGRVGLLYGLNTLGAAAGAFVSTWVLLPRLGLDGSVKVAALCNLAAAAAVAGIGLTRVREQMDDAGQVEPLDPMPSQTHALQWPFWMWVSLYGLAGFQALSLEIVWFRLLGVMVKSSAFTFGTLLTTYLSGLGLGAAASSGIVRRVRRPARAFLLLQGFVGVYAGVSVYALVRWLPSNVFPALWAYFANAEPFDALSAVRTFWTSGADPAMRTQFVRLYVLLPAVLVGPPTVAMGASFPLLQKVALVNLAQVGRRVGRVVAANIAGSAVGSIVTGWLALTLIGSAGSIKVLAGLGGVFLALGVTGGAARQASSWLRAAVGLAAMAAVVLGLSALPDAQTLWATFHGSPREWTVVAEDASGLSLVKMAPNVAGGGSAGVFIEGIAQSWLPYGSIHSVLGALPAFVHPHPREAAVIGLGSGDTLFSLAGRTELSRITCIEIIQPQLATLREWSKRTGYPALTDLLSDPRIQFQNGDGRVQLMRTSRRFDIIEADALRPTQAYSGNLYSLGYFKLLRARLAPGGLAVTWSPTERVRDTFVQAFPYVLSFGQVDLGSSDPIPFEPDRIRASLDEPQVREYYRRAGIEVRELLAPYLGSQPRRIEAARAPRPFDVNDDLFPRDEFGVRRP